MLSVINVKKISMLESRYLEKCSDEDNVELRCFALRGIASPKLVANWISRVLFEIVFLTPDTITSAGGITLYTHVTAPVTNSPRLHRVRRFS